MQRRSHDPGCSVIGLEYGARTVCQSQNTIVNGVCAGFAVTVRTPDQMRLLTAADAQQAQQVAEDAALNDTVCYDGGRRDQQAE
jgi:hypothetical protein